VTADLNRLNEISQLIVALHEVHDAIKNLRGAIDASGTAVMREVTALTTHLKESRRQVWPTAKAPSLGFPLGLGETAQAIQHWDTREQKKSSAPKAGDRRIQRIKDWQAQQESPRNKRRKRKPTRRVARGR
jgi:hypothetical protein